MRNKYTCIESFSGCGGMSIGLKEAGISIKFAFDLDQDAVESYKLNVGKECVVADAKELSIQDILDASGLEVGELDIFSGGPPCQGFSKQRRGAHLCEDERNNLIHEFVRFVNGIRPKFFILENVAIFGQKRGMPYLVELAESLEDYDFYPKFYNSADFGLAQTRQRFVLVGKNKNINSEFIFPIPTVDKWKTVGEVIGDLPEPPNDYSEHPTYHNHQKNRISIENEKRISYVPQGGGWQDIPWEFRLKCHQVANVKSGGWPDVYGRLKWEGQCPTITGGFDSFSRGRYAHPIADRAITAREAARLQGFPDKFKFIGNRSEVRRQIGNAVPPPLAKAIGIEIINAIKESRKATHKVDKKRSNYFQVQKELKFST